MILRFIVGVDTRGGVRLVYLDLGFSGEGTKYGQQGGKNECGRDKFEGM